MGLFKSKDPNDTEALAERAHGFRLLWPVAMLALISGHAPYAISGATGAAFVPLAAVLLLSLVPLGLFWGRIRNTQPHHIVIGLAVAATGMGAASGVVMAALTAQPELWLFSLMIGASCAVVGTVLSRLPITLVGYSSGLMLSLVLGTQAAGGAGVLATALACVMVFALLVARADFKTARSLARALEQSSRPSRMLGELEQAGTVWFWETDFRGRITYLTPKIAATLGQDPAKVVGRPLAMIAAEPTGDSKGGSVDRSITFYLSTQTAFSDLQVRAACAEERYWAVSGRPVYDSFGQVRGFIGTGSDLTEMRRSEAEVTRLAKFDALTGLANRSEIGNLLRQSLKLSTGSSRSAALFLIDLDRFKNVNDTLGHPAGDALLKQVGTRLSQVIGSNGHVGRLGGDEFEVVLPGNMSSARLEMLAKQLIEAVSRPYLIEGSTVSIGASVGIAIAPEDGRTVEELTRNGDLALYAAKAAGRGVHRFYESDMHSSANWRREIEGDLNEALAKGGLRLVYQPVVTCQTEQVTGFEALVRWNHPVHGPISPADFIPIAEESNLIERIGEWVMRRACEEAQGWAVPARVAVNVSPTQFANPDFPTLVAQVLAQTGLAADRLELEITEGVFMNDMINAERQFETLKRIGVRLALDDFGTGYSSLGYLQSAPLDKIKIDQSFVRGATLGNNQNAAIIRAIVTLAESLHMETTAEGAETEDEINLIRELGCSHIQGYYYGPPMEVADLIAKMGSLGSEPTKVGHKTSRAPRLSILRRAGFHTASQTLSVRMRNISADGVMVEMPVAQAAGERVRIAVQDGPEIDGTIVWWADNRCGVAFDEQQSLEWLKTERQWRTAS